MLIRVTKKFKRILDEGQKKRIKWLIILMVIGADLEILGVSMMYPLITVIMQPNIMNENMLLARFCTSFNIMSSKELTLVCIFGMIILFIIKDLFLIGQYYIQYRFVYNNRFLVQKQLLESYMKRPYEYFLHVESGEVLRVLQADVTGSFNLLATLLSFFTEIVVTIMLIITVLVISPVMTIFLVIILSIAMSVIMKIVKPILQKYGIVAQKSSSQTYKWLLQSINGIKEIKVSQKEKYFQTNYEISGRQTIMAEKWNSIIQNIPRLLIEMVSICSVLLSIAIMIFMGAEIEGLVPALGAFVMAAVKLLPSANRIVNASNAIAYSEPALDKLVENMQMIGDDEERKESNHVGEKKTIFTFEKEIQLASVTYAYPNTEKKILENANMIIPIGKSVGIVGTSGAGKTTAVDILLGLLKPENGEILIDGIDIRENYKQWLSHIGYIPQMIFMLDDTIRANIAFGNNDQEDNDVKIWKALEEAQLSDFVRELPEGLNTRIGERGIRLSGGQRQRIGIARALYPDPDILIFDEATSALDNETEADIMESIEGLHGKKTLVIIAHRLTTIEGCDVVYRVSDGNIVREK